MEAKFGYTLDMGKDIITAKIYDSHEYPWDNIKDEILTLEKDEFGKNAWSEATLKKGFTGKDAVAVILINSTTGQIIGFSHSVKGGLDHNFKPVDKADTAYIENTIIGKAYRGKGLVGLMMDKLEEELIKKGYKFLERDARLANGYAANIKRHYQDRIVESSPHNSRYGEEYFFRIKLR